MKQRMMLLAGRYRAALRRHLKAGRTVKLQPALRLGRRAVVLGLETLELARMHEQALVALRLGGATKGTIKRAKIFFAEVISPIVETHRAARESKTKLDSLNETLNHRTLELAAAKRQLQRGVIRRKRMEGALKKSGKHDARLLKDSLQLQEVLRQLTHEVLTAQEDERKNISRELRDEIAQTLLGIQVRLLSLKQEARANTKGLKNGIASTQRLVLESAKSVRRVARELGN